MTTHAQHHTPTPVDLMRADATADLSRCEITFDEFSFTCWIGDYERRADPIRTHYDPKPIPLRQFDWSAIRDSYEPAMPIGYGRTEAEAIADLIAQEDE